jgi:ubiquinone/menaquinone biosynthesis C-methylase UbiE
MPTREEIIVRQIASHFKPHQQILDIGAGSGRVAEMLHRKTGAHFTLLDVVDYNSSALPLYLFDGRALPYENDTFDHTLLVFVLHHNLDPRPVLREALRVSRQSVLLVENDVRGFVRRPVTQFIDSIEHYRKGVPRCYFTKSVDEWLMLAQEIPARGELLSTFKIGWFWNNALLRITK